MLGRGSSNGCLCLCYVYSAEIYPTVIRNAGIGSSSFWVKQKKCFIQHFVGKLFAKQARIGPMIAPYIADLRAVDPGLPLVVFGMVALLAWWAQSTYTVKSKAS